ncbi:TauD/TfdA family dioxygenase [Streptomyces sp. NPDC018059]|uniref:TauD/TfdA family dioxygenase n=1 Tax=Streptomyces sp. NPDC018059 TaxID=3365041 RepID=UPI0037ACF5E0
MAGMHWPPRHVMSNSIGEALARFSSARHADQLRDEGVQRAVLDSAREEVAGLGDLLDTAAAAVRSAHAVIIENFPVDDIALAVAASALGRADAGYNGPRPDTLVHDVVDSAVRPYRDPDPLHTDSPMLRRPHAYLALLCVRPSPNGDGETVLVRAADVADELAGQDRLRPLCDPCYPFAVPHDPGAQRPVVITNPILTSAEGSTTVRYCPVRVTAGVQLAGHRLDAQHLDALRAFEHTLQRPELTTSFLLRAGDLLLFDNQRLLHGRTDVRPAGASRHLKRIKLRASRSPGAEA